MSIRRLCWYLLVVLPAGLSTGLFPRAAAHAAPPGGLAPWAQVGVPPADWRGYRVVTVSYLLQAPDGSWLRVTRGSGDTGGWPGEGFPRWDGAFGPPADGAPGAGAALRTAWWGFGWLGDWLSRGQAVYGGAIEYARATWSLIVRALNLLAVLVLLAGTGALWFLLRPALLGLGDRQAFLFLFGVLCALWYYATGIATPVLYAGGLLALPWIVVSVLTLCWRALRALLAPA